MYIMTARVMNFSAIFVLYPTDCVSFRILVEEYSYPKINRRRFHNGLVCLVVRHWLSSFLLGITVASFLFYYAVKDPNGSKYYSHCNMKLCFYADPVSLSYFLYTFLGGPTGTDQEAILSEKVHIIQEENDILRRQLGAYKAELVSHLQNEPHSNIALDPDDVPLQTHHRSSLSATHGGPCGDKVLL